MQVEFAPEAELGGRRFSASVMWTEAEGRWPKRGGRFPADHPCFTNEAGFQAFHDLGYLTGLYSEGDGFSIDWTGAAGEQIIHDLERCFGWIVVNASCRAIPRSRHASA